ncbi:MAG TPA: Rv3654c family TadE-like protein, partial [Acidimicrobiia bacterium]|nr:Rv3654c family TadE-like protein [Acidimicrobiia bacterium]
SRSERGSGTVLAMATMAVVIVASLALVAATQIVVGRARAVTAADAAALAAAVHTFPPSGEGISPSVAAIRMAGSNGARLTLCRCRIDSSQQSRTVEVRVETQVQVVLLGPVMVRAASRAEYVP